MPIHWHRRDLRPADNVGFANADAEATSNGASLVPLFVGVDAQPYFRVFNPMTQGERHDPDAEYIQRYVPELRGVEPDVIHDWTERSPTQRQRTAPAYPAPIVDHAERREDAIAMFERARGSPNGAGIGSIDREGVSPPSRCPRPAAR